MALPCAFSSGEVRRARNHLQKSGVSRELADIVITSVLDIVRSYVQMWFVLRGNSECAVCVYVKSTLVSGNTASLNLCRFYHMCTHVEVSVFTHA